MPNSLTINSFDASESQQLIQLVNGAYRGEASKKGWTTEADLLDGDLRIDGPALTILLRKPGAAILTCRKDETIMGCVYLQVQGSKLYLGMLTVAPGSQGNGIGKMLLEAAEKHAVAMNCSLITMNVIDARDSLIAWYERHGYHRTGETKPFPADPKFGMPKQPLEFIILEKTITAGS